MNAANSRLRREQHAHTQMNPTITRRVAVFTVEEDQVVCRLAWNAPLAPHRYAGSRKEVVRMIRR
jgi:hypothetical protein